MKRILLAGFILALGTTVFCAFRSATAEARQTLLASQTAWQTQTQQITQLRSEREELLEKVRTGKEQLATLPAVPPGLKLMRQILARSDQHNLSGEEIEQLLAEFGFNWNTTGDYLIVSKKSLAGISLDGMKGMKLTPTACAVLAVTPEEKLAIESLTEQLGAERSAWVVAHAQRDEPSGNVLAKYSLPLDEEFSRSLSGRFTDGIFSTLGKERGDLFQQYSTDWMQSVGMLNGPAASEHFESKPATLTVERYKSGDQWNLNYSLEQAGSAMSTSVNPRQPFPEAFKPLFPNGWIDVAAREGFELPKEFKKKPTNP